MQYNSGTDTTTVVNHLKYGGFGNITAQSNSAYQPLFAYTGQMLDSAAGLYYYHARWYDATIGRFISQDSTGFAAGDPNLYRYVGNGSTGFVDPTGEEAGSLTNPPSSSASAMAQMPETLAIVGPAIRILLRLLAGAGAAGGASGCGSVPKGPLGPEPVQYAPPLEEGEESEPPEPLPEASPGDVPDDGHMNPPPRGGPIILNFPPGGPRGVGPNGGFYVGGQWNYNEGDYGAGGGYTMPPPWIRKPREPSIPGFTSPPVVDNRWKLKLRPGAK